MDIERGKTMNKFADVFNENMTNDEANLILFEIAKTIKEEDKSDLIEAWKENNHKIFARIDREYGDLVLTNNNV